MEGLGRAEKETLMPDPIDPPGGDDLASNPAVQALLAKAIKEATSGLAANKDEILAEKKALADQLATATKQWEGLDPAAVRNLMDRMANDEETKLMAEGKIDEVINRRTERLQADHKKQLTTFEQMIADRDAKLNESVGTVKSLRIEGSLSRAASELGLVPSATEDAMRRAKEVFKIDEKGNLIAEENGSTAYGKDGKTPMTPAEWLESMKEKAPHWFPAPSGGGAGGGSGRGGSHSITREQARNRATYLAAEEAAKKAGAQLKIVG